MNGTFTYEVVVLAGGRGARMGGVDKGLLSWQGLPLIDHVLQRLRQQTVTAQRILISANRHMELYQQRAEVITDEVAGFEGPLRGIQAALRRCRTAWLLVVPCDSPVLPVALAETLWTEGNAQAAWAQCDGELYPLCCLLPVTCLPTLDDYLMQGHRRVRTFLEQLGAQVVTFADTDAFENFNVPEHLESPLHFNAALPKVLRR